MGQRARILTQILGVYGWEVAEAFFETLEGHRVWPVGNYLLPPDVVLVFRLKRRWARGRCPYCDRVCVMNHGTEKTRRWHDLPWAGHPVVVECTPERVVCKRCDATPVEALPWADPYQRETRRLQQHLALQAASMPTIRVAAQYGLSWSTVRRAEGRTRPAKRVRQLSDRLLSKEAGGDRHQWPKNGSMREEHLLVWTPGRPPPLDSPLQGPKLSLRVLACQWVDFDFDHGVVAVRNKPEFGFRTKYGRSRSIPLWPEVKEYFIRRHTEMGRPGPQGLVFPTVSGDKYAMNTMSFANYTAETVKRAGITRPVTKFHDLRRTFGSLCLEAGVPLEVVAQWLGHRSVDTTRKVYARISGRFSKDQMERVGEYWQTKRAEGATEMPPLPSGISNWGGQNPSATKTGDHAATGGDQGKLVN